MKQTRTAIGKSVQRIDAKDKTCGTIRYTDDLSLPGMLYTAFVKSPHAHATIDRIDPSPALDHPGVLGNQCSKPDTDQKRGYHSRFQTVLCRD